MTNTVPAIDNDLKKIVVWRIKGLLVKIPKNRPVLMVSAATEEPWLTSELLHFSMNAHSDLKGLIQKFCVVICLVL